MPLDEVGQNGIEAVVHLKGEGEVHGGVDQALVQPGGHLVGLAAQLGGHAPDLVPVKVDGSYPFGVAAVAHLVALAVEPVAAAAVGDHHLAVAQDGHPAEGVSQALPGPVQAGLAVHVQSQLGLGGADGGTELLPLRQHGHQESGHLVDVLGVLTGGGFFNHGVLGLLHDLAAQMGGGDFQGIAPILEDVAGLVHQGLQLVLCTKGIF